jgi:predicted oxidoreductase
MHAQQIPGKHVDAYKTLEGLLKKGRVRSIGVSNYTVEDYLELKDKMNVKPVVNQVSCMHDLHIYTSLSVCLCTYACAFHWCIKLHCGGLFGAQGQDECQACRESGKLCVICTYSRVCVCVCVYDFGVSNYTVGDYLELKDKMSVKPVVNQVS